MGKRLDLSKSEILGERKSGKETGEISQTNGHQRLRLR